MSEFTVWDNGKPIAASSDKEAKRLTGRILIIDIVLKEMGYENGYENYQEYIKEMTSNGISKFIEFNSKVDNLVAKARKRGINV